MVYFYLLFPLIIGTLSGLLADFNNNYNSSIMIPSIVFIIVWSILYLLMGLSSYIVRDDKKSLIIFYIQLLFNALWTFIFFNLHMYLLAFIWILILIILVILMIIRFYKIDKFAALIQIPYLLWLIFAAFLSLNVFLLN